VRRWHGGATNFLQDPDKAGQTVRGFPQNKTGNPPSRVLSLQVMNAAQKEEIRRGLTTERQRIVAEWQNHGGEGGPIDHWESRNVEERAVQIASENVERRIALDDRNLLMKVDHALERLDAGTYETCENCGTAIPMERLMAKPSASLCIACQELKDAGWPGPATPF
jgi:DnaK suppressor protein